jgi:hypothetical protein
MFREASNLCLVFAAGGACPSSFVGERNPSRRFGGVAIQPNLNTRKFAYRDAVVILLE